MYQKALSNGEIVIIREAEKGDAASLLDFLAKVAEESDFLTFGPGEFAPTLEQETAIVEEMQKLCNSVMLVAVIADRVVGNINFRGGARARIRHTGEFGITVLQEYWGMGIGAGLLECLLEWAKDSQVIRKINLRVRTDNDRGIALYSKLGFREEGRISREFYLNGEFFDTIQMGKHIDED